MKYDTRAKRHNELTVQLSRSNLITTNDSNYMICGFRSLVFGLFSLSHSRDCAWHSSLATDFCRFFFLFIK